jgi:hypothetical protein
MLLKSKRNYALNFSFAPIYSNANAHAKTISTTPFCSKCNPPRCCKSSPRPSPRSLPVLGSDGCNLFFPSTPLGCRTKWDGCLAPKIDRLCCCCFLCQLCGTTPVATPYLIPRFGRPISSCPLLCTSFAVQTLEPIFSANQNKEWQREQSSSTKSRPH